MKLSFSTRGWPELSFSEMLDVALDMGFSGVEVYNLAKFDPLMDKGGPFHKYNTAATVRQLREKGISIPCFSNSSFITPTCPSPPSSSIRSGASPSDGVPSPTCAILRSSASRIEP